MPVEYFAPKSIANIGIANVPILGMPVLDIPMSMAQPKYTAHAQGEEK